MNVQCLKQFLVFLVVIAIFVFEGCQKGILNEEINSDTPTLLFSHSRGNAFNGISKNWKDQLSIPINTPPSFYKNAELELLSFSEKYAIINNEQLRELIKSLLNEMSYFPVVNDSNQLELKTKEEIINRDQDLKTSYDFNVIGERLDSLLTVNMKVVELKWKYKGTIVYTLCVVDDVHGFIYDNIISYAFVPKFVQYINIPHSLIHLKSMSEGGDPGSGGETDPDFGTRRLRIEEICQGVASSTFGEFVYAEVSHTAYANGKNGVIDFQYAIYSCNASNQNGKAGVDCDQLEQVTGNNGYSLIKMAWWYSKEGLSFKIIWQGIAGFKLEAESQSGVATLSGGGTSRLGSTTLGWQIDG